MEGAGRTVCAVLLCGLVVSTLGPGDKHSLYYLYTVQSKSSTDRVSEFSAVTLLNDRQIDSYSSTDGIRTPKQDWMKEMKESEWKEGTDKLKHDGQQLNKILNIQIEAFRHDESDGHTLQWRVGCEAENHSGGSLSVLNCINEYGYDGQNLISYNWTSRRWSASVSQAKALEEEWNAGRVDQRCEDCVRWLKEYLKFSTTNTKLTPPDVHVFVKKSVIDSTKLTLTCLATGFYPKDMKMSVRKFRTSLPEHLLRSSGVRPNEDGTYQLRKSVEIQEDETADYNCYMNHSSITEPVIKQWERSHSQSGLGLAVGGVVGVIVLAVLVGVVIFILKKKLKAVISEPKNLKVVETTPTSFEVQWEKAQGKIDRYIVLVSLSQTNRSDGLSQQIEVPSGKNSALIERLEPGCLYIITVFAEKGRTRSHRATVKAKTSDCSNTDSERGSCGNVENVGETISMLQRTSSDPDRRTNDPPPDEQQTLLTSTV